MFTIFDETDFGFQKLSFDTKSKIFWINWDNSFKYIFPKENFIYFVSDKEVRI